MTTPVAREAVTLGQLALMREQAQPIVMVTAYDCPSARVTERAGVDIVLVGDSAATTTLGYSSTRDISLDEMLVLVRAVRRGIVTPLLVGDMPFGSYEHSDLMAVRSGRQFMDAGCDAVKLEGAGVMTDRIRALVAAGIPVMGHVGLTPQREVGTSGYRAHGRTADDAMAIVHDAEAIESAGCFAIVVEAVATPVADAIVTRVRVPTIGIGAGPAPDGQVLVFHDLLGLTEAHQARFVKRYAAIGDEMVAAVAAYAEDVRNHRYPAPEHGYAMPREELARFQTRMAAER